MITGNEPAMPKGQSQSGTGLTIREHFAVMAMQAIISKHGIIHNNPSSIASNATKYADALIRQLNKIL